MKYISIELFCDEIFCYKMKESRSKSVNRRSQVADVLQTLHVVPSFSEAFSGDILPEAVLLKNILEEMMTNLNYLSTLTYILTAPLLKSGNGSKLVKEETNHVEIKVYISVRTLQNKQKLRLIMYIILAT